MLNQSDISMSMISARSHLPQQNVSPEDIKQKMRLNLNNIVNQNHVSPGRKIDESLSARLVYNRSPIHVRERSNNRPAGGEINLSNNVPTLDSSDTDDQH
jgi:hypothetical protein